MEIHFRRVVRREDDVARLQPLKIEWDIHLVKTRKCRIVCLVTSVDTLPLRSRGRIFYDLAITRRWSGTCNVYSNHAKWGNGGLMDITLTQTPKPHSLVAVVLSVVPTMDEKTERSTKS